MKRFRRWPWVKDITGLSRTTVWRLEKKGKFPKRRHISPNSVGWLEHEIFKWMDDCEDVLGGQHGTQ